MISTYFTLLKRLWPHIRIYFRRRLALLLVLVILVPFFEVVSISAMLPFIGAMTSSGENFLPPAVQSLMDVLGFEFSVELFAIAFGLAALVTGAMRFLVLWLSVRLSFAISVEITNEIYNKVLSQPYQIHMGRNSSEVINTISNKSHLIVHNLLIPTLTLIGSALMLAVIIGAFFVIDPLITSVAAGGVGLIYLLVILLTRRRLNRDGSLIAQEGTKALQAVQEGLGGIRDILIDGTQLTYSRIYLKIDQRLRHAQGNTVIVGHSTRVFVETLGILLIVGLVYSLSKRPTGLVDALPVLGVLVMGVQRLLPMFQQAYAALISIQSGRPSVEDTLKLLEIDSKSDAGALRQKPILFDQAISFNNLGFRYQPDLPFVFRGVDLKINKGERIGLIGETGSGKSTLLDVVMGLLDPSQGTLEIDGSPVTPTNRRSWQAHIAHVPQSIFLADTSIEENIAFGVSAAEIDSDRVRECARQAQISDVIESLPSQYLTRVGERGVRLSGGQRQRIGIARALYKRADIIIFDEATSALDNETEAAVMKAIEALDERLTVIIVAHRLTTLKMCSRVVELRDGRISRIVSPDSIIMDPSSSGM